MYQRLMMFALLALPLILAGAPAAAQADPGFKPAVYTLTAPLSGGEVVPPVETPGSGTVIAVLVGNQLTVTGVYRDLSRPLAPGGASVNAAAPGEAGPWVALPAEQGVLEEPGAMILTDTRGTSGTFSGVFTLTGEQREELGDGLFYVQLATLGNRGGELRGQLTTEVDFGFGAEELVGVWRADSGSYVEYLPDGTARVADSLEELETGPSITGTWTLEGHVLTWVRGENSEGCEVGAVDVYYLEGLEEGRRRSRELAIECTGGGVDWLYFTRVPQ